MEYEEEEEGGGGGKEEREGPHNFRTGNGSIPQEIASRISV